MPLPLLETLSKIFKCQGLPVIFIEPRQYQQNTSLSVAASFKGRKKSHKERGQVSRECGIHSPFCFWPKTGECCEGRDSVMMQKPVPTLPLFRMFFLRSVTQISEYCCKTADVQFVLEKQILVHYSIKKKIVFTLGQTSSLLLHFKD